MSQLYAEADKQIGDAMDMSHEQGIQEIEFFYANPRTSPKMGKPAASFFEARDAATATVEEDTLKLMQKDKVESVSRQGEEAASVFQEDQYPPHEDEFSTLMDDIDQAATYDAQQSSPGTCSERQSSADEGGVVSGHKAVLKNPYSGFATTPDRVGAHQASRHSSEVDGLRLSSGQQEADLLSSEPAQLPTAQAEQNPMWQQDHQTTASNSMQTANLPPQIGYRSAILANLHNQRGWSQLSPRRNQPVGPPLQAPMNPPFSPTNLASLQSVKGLSQLPPRILRRLDLSTMLNVTMPSQASPTLPSSSGKSTLFDEMRGEEEQRKPSSRNKIAKPVFTDRKDVMPKKKADAIGKHVGDANAAAECDDEGEKDAPLSPTIDRDFLKKDETRHHMGAALLDRPNQSTTTARRRDSMLAAEDGELSASAPIATKKLTATREQPRVTEQDATAETLQQETTTERSGRSNTAQQPKQEPAQESESSDMSELSDLSDDELASQPTVPSKRKKTALREPSEDNVLAGNKKRKITSVGNLGMHGSTEAAPGTALVRDQKLKKRPGRNGMSEMEMKELFWSDILSGVDHGTGRTRAKTEEEKAKAPNASGAAKARHRRK